MAIRTYDLTLDTKNDIMPDIVFGRQGDRTGAVRANVTLTDSSSPINLTNKRLIFKAKTADGTYIVLDSYNFTIVDAANGKFTYDFPNALWSEAGRIKNAYFSLYGDDNVAESTFGLIFVVQESVDMNEEQKTDYITIVDQTIQELTATMGDLADQLQQALKDFSDGAFYSRTDADAKFYSKTDAQTRDTYVDSQLTQIRTIANTNVTADTGWQEEGLIYINGFTRDQNDAVSYRTLQFGANLHKVLLGGWLSGPSLAKGVKVDCLTLPANIASMFQNAKTFQGRFMINLNSGGQYLNISINGNNLRVENLGSNNDMAGIGGFLELEAWV